MAFDQSLLLELTLFELDPSFCIGLIFMKFSINLVVSSAKLIIILIVYCSPLF